MVDLSFPPGGEVAVIYAAGAGSPNPGPGGWGAVLTYGDHVREVHGFVGETTDAGMQLMAVVRALECLNRPVRVQARTDSEHVRQGITELLPQAYAAAWRTSTSEFNRNARLWTGLAAAAMPHEVEWLWGEHEQGSGSAHLARAGELARQGLASAQSEAPDAGGQGGGKGPIELSDPLVRLAAAIGVIKQCNPVAVWERLRAVTADDAALPGLIADMVEAVEGSDPLHPIGALLAVLNDPALAALIVPSRRHSRRDDVVTYRIRADLRDTKPPVWRRVELASDLFLDDVHEIMQTVFDWSGTHLHKFSSGSSAYSQDAEDYLCPYQVEEGEFGIPEEDVRLDEVLVDVKDRLYYTYDFGDGWEYLIRLEKILPRDSAAPRAVCIDGRRVGPEENCGGVQAYESIAMDDPEADVLEASDFERINEMLAELSRGGARVEG